MLTLAEDISTPAAISISYVLDSWPLWFSPELGPQTQDRQGGGSGFSSPRMPMETTYTTEAGPCSSEWAPACLGALRRRLQPLEKWGRPECLPDPAAAQTASQSSGTECEPRCLCRNQKGRAHVWPMWQGNEHLRAWTPELGSSGFEPCAFVLPKLPNPSGSHYPHVSCV